MISYYDLVNLLDTISDEKQDNDIVLRLNSLEVTLEGERYYRFLDHLSLTIQDRLHNAYDALIKKIDEVKDDAKRDDELFYELFKMYTDEVSLCFQIASVKLVHEENQIELGRVIMNVNNELLHELTKYLKSDNEEINHIIEDAYLEENINDKEVNNDKKH